MTHQEEKKNERTALVASIAIYAVAFLLMFFIVAWRTPDPPYGAGEPGIELNFGTSDEGSGEVQPDSPVGSEGTQDEEPQISEPVKVVPQPTEPDEEKMLTSEEDDSPAIIKETKKEVKPVEIPKEKTDVKPTETPKKEEVKPKETPKAVYNPNAQKTESSNKTSDGKAGAPGNHGDDKDKTGDKGNPEGSLDSKALYGKQGKGGSGGGNGVSMSGFNGFSWPAVKTPTLPDEAYGVYEFIVKVDDQGDIVDIKSLQRGLSLEAERKLKEVIQNLVFIPKGSNLPAQSEGKITFRVVSR